MSQDKYDRAFEELLERKKYDNAQEAMYQLVHISFKTGWQAAGGEPPQPQTKIRLFPNNPDNDPPQ